MNYQQETKLLNYLQRIAIATEKLAECLGQTTIIKEYATVRVTDNPELDSVDLQHVIYDDAQLGREK